MLEGRRRDYIEASLRRALGPVLLDLSGAQQLGGGRALRGQALGRIGGIRFDAQVLWVDGDFESELVDRFQSREYSFKASTRLNLGKWQLPVEGGVSQKLSRAIGIYRAKELSLTGNYLTAERAYEWGLLSRLVAPEELLATCRAIAGDMLSCDPDVLVGYKRVIDEGFAATFGEGLRLEREASLAHARASVTPEAIAKRRADVQARGRQQSKQG